MIIYTVKKGDSLWKISRSYGVSLDALIAANPDISDPNYILVGQQINIPEMWRPEINVDAIPVPPDSTVAGAAADLPACTEDPSLRPCIYTAHQGDTLEMISHVFMTPLSRLLYFNLQYAKDEPLSEGTRIIIPEGEIFPCSPSRHHPPLRKR